MAVQKQVMSQLLDLERAQIMMDTHMDPQGTGCAATASWVMLLATCLSARADLW
jgi:hypothetical protein